MKPLRYQLQAIRKPPKEIKHPEQKDDEIFIGNDIDSSFKASTGWKTKRRGKQAYQQLPFLTDGTLIPVNNKAMFPTFIKKEEFNQKQEERFIKEEETKNDKGKIFSSKISKNRKSGD